MKLRKDRYWGNSDISVTESYVGRFAPSPTGPLHFGSLVAALASFLDAKHYNGRWLLRMEDLDEPRVSQEAASEILRTLDDFGLHWDGELLTQSTQLAKYTSALETLSHLNLLYPCTCSRKSYQGIYQGLCRNRKFDATADNFSVRVKTDSRNIEFKDNILGHHIWQLERDCGDFIVKRKDKLIAYQLAVVVDDNDQGITHIVRGSDLLDSTPWQIYLQQCLDFPTPAYAHLPVILNIAGDKLSKQTGAKPLDKSKPIVALKQAIKCLGQTLPPRDLESSLTQWLDWAARQWKMEQVPRVSKLMPA